eukprot:COSAG06_NODE_6373_length_2959_cov_3.413986_4_plen_91_part_00
MVVITLSYVVMASAADSHCGDITIICYQILCGAVRYYDVEHDLRGKDGAALIDTDVIDVYLLTGEYDWSATPKISQTVRITIVYNWTRLH